MVLKLGPGQGPPSQPGNSLSLSCQFKVEWLRSLNSAIRDLQSLIDDRERLAHLGFSYTQRRVREERVPPHKRVEPFLTKELAERLHLLRGAVEGRHRFSCLRISHQLDDSEKPNVARRAHRRVTTLQILEHATHQRPHTPRVFNETIFFVHRDGCERRGTRERVAVVRKAAVEDIFLEVICYLPPHAHRSQLHVCA